MSVRTSVIVALITAMLGLTASPASAATRFVDCDHGGDLQATIDAADAGDVLVASGTCQGYFTVTKDLTILGFFSVTLDGSTEDNALPVLLVDNGASLVLENAVVTGGFGSFPSHGAGIDVFRGSLTLRNAEVYGNNGQVGGGISVSSGAVASLEDVHVHDNIAQRLGGGVFSNGSTTIVDSTINDNHALFGTGGGIFAGGTMIVQDSTISDNRTPNFGGAIHTIGTTVVQRTSMTGNTGGISNDGTLTVNRSALVGNRASSSSGLGNGGGLWNWEDGTATITTSTISGNRAHKGGGVKNEGTATLRAVTLVGNTAFPASAGAVGGGVHNEGSLTVRSTVVAGNSGTDPDCATTSPLTSGGSNYLAPACAVTSPVASDLFGTNPGVAAAADNGGPTLTARLLPGSPLVNAGACLTSTDQRGVTRPQHGACDIGAYENRGPTTAGTPALTPGTSPNTGSFTLSWTGATDPDGDPVTYLVERADADDAAFTPVRVVSTPTVTLTGQQEGTQRYRIVATDGLNPAAPSPVSSPVVVDRTGPAAPTITADRDPEHVADGGAAWFRDTVTVTTTPGADPLLQDGSSPSGTVGSPTATMYDTAGEHVTSATSTDAVGNRSATATLTVHVDTTDPTVGFVGCPATALLGEVVSVAWAAADTGAGLVGPASGGVPLDTATVGPSVATVAVADAVGHTANARCEVVVVYDFSGFAAPLRSDGEASAAIAGRVLPVRFGLAGDQGLDVIAAGSPTVVLVDCTTRAALGDEVPATADRALSFDDRKQRYTWWWSTDRAWRHTCARITLALIDGTSHSAEVDFR